MKDVSLIVYPASDMDKAKAFFRQLTGGEPYAESPYYVGFKSGDIEIGLVPNAQPGALAYWTVDDIRASLASLLEAGGTIAQDVTDVGHGLLVASVTEPNGSVVGLRQMPQRQ